MAPDVPITGEETSGVRPWPLALVVATSLAIGACFAVLWLSAGSLMSIGSLAESGDVGSIVSRGVTWGWTMPVAIVVLLVAMQTSKGANDKYDTPSLMLLSWSTLFLALSVSFFRAGLTGPPVAGFALGMYIAGGSFVLVGLGGLYAFVVAYRTWWAMDKKKAAEQGLDSVRPGFRIYQLVTALCLAAGAAGGWALFRVLGG